MWDGWAVVIESRDIKLHGLLTSATIVRVVTLTLWKLLRFFELIYLPGVCTMAFVSAISGFSPTVFGCSVIEYHLFRGGEREREIVATLEQLLTGSRCFVEYRCRVVYPLLTPLDYSSTRVVQPCTRSIFHVPFPDVVSGNQRLIDPPFRPNLTSSTDARNREKQGEIEVPFLKLDIYIYICIIYYTYRRR